MRFLFFLILLPAVWADPSPLWSETRAFRGLLLVQSEAALPPAATGAETQMERVEFLLLCEPPEKRTPGARLPLRMRDRSGSYRLEIEHREGGVATAGSSKGDLHPVVRGEIDPESGEVSFSVSVTPRRLVARTTLSGMDEGRFKTFRAVAERTALCDGFEAEGTLDEEGVCAGTREAIDRKGKYSRMANFTWRLERIDPLLRGVVLDQNGDPLAGLRVLARTTDPERVRLRLPPLVVEGRTDARGRFSLAAHPARWEIEIEGERRAGSVVEGRLFREGVLLRTEEAPFTEARLSVYRLESLPEVRALRGAFRDDLAGYFRYVRERHDDRRLAAALLPPPGE